MTENDDQTIALVKVPHKWSFLLFVTPISLMYKLGYFLYGTLTHMQRKSQSYILWFVNIKILKCQPERESFCQNFSAVEAALESFIFLSSISGT